MLISLVLLLAQITPLADLSRVAYHWIFLKIHFIITLHSSIAETSASQYKKKLKLKKMLSILVMSCIFVSCIFMSCNYMSCNFDGPLFSCPFSALPVAVHPCKLIDLITPCRVKVTSLQPLPLRKPSCNSTTSQY